jgi:hypothetical protein
MECDDKICTRRHRNRDPIASNDPERTKLARGSLSV